MDESTKQDQFYSENYQAIEASIVAGQHEKGLQLLKLIQPKTLPFAWSTKFAELANRFHQPLFALKALHRFINPEKPFHQKAADKQKMIYGYSLCLLGATGEALDLLNSVQSVVSPEVNFTKALTYFRQWNYVQSIPLLRQYIADPNLDDYRRVIGEVNLAAALIAMSDWDQALPLLHQIQSICRDRNYELLLGNCFELEAQVLFFQKKYDLALERLAIARTLLENQKGLYLLFVDKWIHVCHLFKNPTAENLLNLQQVRSQAVLLEEREIIRECELFEAIAMQNELLLKKVIMGTPSEHYRQRARQLYGRNFNALGQFGWDLNGQAGDDSSTIILNPYEKKSDSTALYERPQLLALLEALTLDFYRPCHLGGLFKSIYPDELFNPYTSPARVLRLLKRLDQWFTANKYPLRIDFKKSEFSIQATGAVRVIIHRGQKLSAAGARWTELKSAFKNRTFTTAKVSSVMGLSATSAQRLVKQALAEGKIQAFGHGRSTTYKFSSIKKIKSAA